EGIEEFTRVLFSVLEALKSRYRFRVIYVLDRSSDDSVGVLRRLATQYSGVTILHLSRRFGHQMSLVAGIDYSHGDAMIMMDCDLQHPPEVIPQLLEEFERGCDIVHTIRTYDARIAISK